MTLRVRVLAILLAAAATALTVRAQRGGQDPASDPFKGVTTDGTVRSGLFAIHMTGVSTKPVVQAASQFVGSLTPPHTSQYGQGVR